MQVPVDRLQIKSESLKICKINWQSYVQGHMISEDDFEFITKFDGADNEDRARILLGMGSRGIDKLMYIISRMAKEQTVAYLLTRLDDVIEDVMPVIMQYSSDQNLMPWTCFITLLNRQDMFIAHMSSRLVSKVVQLSSPIYMKGQDLQFYFAWLRSQLATENHDYLQSAVACLQRLLRIPYYRNEFFEFDGVDCLLPLLSTQYGYQLQYQIAFCLWLMSYSQPISLQMRQYKKLIPTLSDVLKMAQKEKVLRMIIATFVNLLNNSSENAAIHREYTLIMIQCKVLRSLELIIQTHCNKEPERGKKTSRNIPAKKQDEIDEDLAQDCELLEQILTEAEQKLSSVDEYISELISGRLEWSPVHKSQRFWRENAHKFNDNKYELLNKLGAILESTASEALELQVACHDLGEYARHYARGKTVLDSLGIKPHIMKLMAHKDQMVKYQALVAVQKIMIQNWEYVSNTKLQVAVK